MVSAKGKGTGKTSKSKAKSSSSPAIVQSMDAPPTPIEINISESDDIYEGIDVVIAQPLTTEASIEESVAVSGNNGEREYLSEDSWMESERKAEEVVFEGQTDVIEREEEENNPKQLNFEEDVNLMNIDGPLYAPGFDEEKDEKNVVGSGRDEVNSMVDEMMKGFSNDIPCEEEVLSTPGTIEELKKRETIVVCEASVGMPLSFSQSEIEENGTLKCINVTGEAEETAQALVGDTSGISVNKKVVHSKKIFKKVVHDPKLVPNDEQSKSEEVRMIYEANAEMSMMVSDMKEGNVPRSCSNIAEAETKETAKAQADSSGNMKVKKPQKIIKKKVVVRKNKLVPENAAESQRLNVKKPEDESKGTSMNSNVKQNEKVEAKNVNEVDKGKKVIKKKKVQGPAQESAAKEDQEEKVEAKYVNEVDKGKKVIRKKKVHGPAEKSFAKDDQERDRSVKDNATEEQLVDAKEKEVKSEGRQRRSRKRNRSGVINAEGIDSSVKENDKAETSNKKSEVKVKNMGMIFMCSSKTKKDCYDYQVMGLPAGKKDIVSKVYKGMRLFLFDFDLRLLYGIYKAAGPGGNNIEPRAFNSNFPSQVRFTLLEDCLPLPEEKFRKVIKDNYYTKKKFNCELSAEQVKNLCELFRSGSKSKGKVKVIKPLQESGRERAAPPVSSSRKWDRSRKRVLDEPWRDHAESGRERAAPVPSSRRQDRSRKRALEEPRHDHVDLDRGYRRWVGDNDYEGQMEDNARHYVHDRHPLVFERREDLAPIAAAPTVALPQLAQPLPRPLTQAPTRGLAYAYGGTSLPGVYLQDVVYERRDYSRPLDVDLYRHEQCLPSLEGRRLREEPELRDPYDAYRESRAYRESIYHSASAVRDYPRTTEYLTQVGRYSVYPSADSVYRRY